MHYEWDHRHKIVKIDDILKLNRGQFTWRDRTGLGKKNTFCYRSTPPSFSSSCFQPKFTRYMMPTGRPDIGHALSDVVRTKRG